jgi:hypothetical protein
MFAIALPMGPGEKEVACAADLLDSLASHEPGPALLVILDDSPQPRNLAEILPIPPAYTPVILRHFRHDLPGEHPRTTNGPLCAGMLQLYRWIAQNRPDVSFVLKCDTDALVIAPFAKKIESAFAAHPQIGMLGAYTRTPNGDERDISYHGGIMRRLHRTPLPWGSPRLMLTHLITRNQRTDTISRHIADACANGYVYGEHCLGGSSALATEVLRRMLKRGYLDDPTLWLPIQKACEDPMIAVYTRAVGMRLQNFVADGEVFGVRYRGLPDSPQRLLERGFSIIHSVKNDPRISEAEIRSFFRDHRSRQLSPVV